jgi:hypothetical protein
MATWHKSSPGYTITMVTLSNYHTYISRRMPDALKTMEIQFMADWIRTNLLYEHGGFWLDASIILHTNLGNLDQTKDFTGFLVPTDPQIPQIENWFFGAPKHSPVLKSWIHEHEKAIAMGPEQYIQASSHIKEPYGMPYLWHQLCLTNALRTNPDTTVMLYSSLATAYYHTNGFSLSEEIMNLALRSHVCNCYIERDTSIILYKLRGITRKTLAEYYQTIGIVNPGSVLGQAGIRTNYAAVLRLVAVVVLIYTLSFH